MEYADDAGLQNQQSNIDPAGALPGENPDVKQATPDDEKKLVSATLNEIRADKKHHEKAFKRMRADMHMAMYGSDALWSEDNYRANIIGRHVKMKTAALYAKNPKIVARRRETMDFAVWDETPEALMMAQKASMALQQEIALHQQTQQAQAPVDPMGMQTPNTPVIPPGMEGAMQQAQAVLADFQQGTARRQFIKKYTKTLELLIAYALREQKPVDFKTGMKQVVRRACTTGVGYVELGFQRETGPRPEMTEKLVDARARLDHMKNLTEQVGEGKIVDGDKEMFELRMMIEQLQAEPEIVLREGLIVDFPQSTKVIPDRLCTNLTGFVGARHITLEYTYSVDQVKEMFGVDLGDGYTGYADTDKSELKVSDESDYGKGSDQKKDRMVCVYKQYDKVSGQMRLVAEGHDSFLRPPAAPDVFVEDFWPVYALTFNSVESEKELFPPSDVYLLTHMQEEYNRSRQGMREHRKAARPKWVYANGLFADETDMQRIANMKPGDMIGLNIDPASEIGKMLQAVPVPGVDPNLYETNQLFTDMQLVGGSQEAQYGATSSSTATESAIAAGATSASDGSAIDDLDGFLTCIARSGGQILQRQMSAEKVTEIVGPGSVWPEMSLADIAGEVYLEIEAGSTGKPNQAVEIRNWQQIAPLLLQMPGINPEWLARETLRRLDDRLDLTDAIISGIPAIVAQNQMQQPNPADAAADPNAQGKEGANNAEKPNPGPGSQAPMGDNHTTPGVIANNPAMGPA